jgi:hypothetical protein
MWGNYTSCLFVGFWRDSPHWARVSSFTRFLDHTLRRTTVGRTLLKEWSALCRDLYLTKHTTLTTNKHPCPRWDWNPRSQQASGLRLRLRGHWDRQSSLNAAELFKWNYHVIRLILQRALCQAVFISPGARLNMVSANAPSNKVRPPQSSINDLGADLV